MLRSGGHWAHWNWQRGQTRYGRENNGRWRRWRLRCQYHALGTILCGLWRVRADQRAWRPSVTLCNVASMRSFPKHTFSMMKRCFLSFLGQTARTLLSWRVDWGWQWLDAVNAVSEALLQALDLALLLRLPALRLHLDKRMPTDTTRMNHSVATFRPRNDQPC